MILTEKGFEPRERQMYTYGRDTDAGDFWSLIRFTTPVNVQDTGLLSQELADGSEAQWLYLPALKNVRRISAGRKGGRFVGSDLYYEDLQDRKVDKDEHRIVGEEAVAGKRCTILESVPVDPSNSVYSKRVSWIDPETLLAYRVDLYEKAASEPTKRLLVNVDQVQKVQGYWTILESTMTHLPSGHQTQILVDAIKYDQGVPDDLFSRKALEGPRLEVRYRP